MEKNLNTYVLNLFIKSFYSINEIVNIIVEVKNLDAQVQNLTFDVFFPINEVINLPSLTF